MGIWVEYSSIIGRMTTTRRFPTHIALPQDHGSWVFLFSPLVIGLVAGQAWNADTLALVVAALAAFLIRQPLTIAVKVYSKRRHRRDLPPARLWSAIYALIGSASLAWLCSRGHKYLLYLALPAIPVFAWHLYLVSKRAERRQAGVEILATGVLALAAPAAYWVGRGALLPAGWVLWLLVWLQSAASIVYAYLRLEQRRWKEIPPAPQRWLAGRRALAYASFNVAATGLLALAGYLPAGIALPYAVQLIETLWGITHPAVQARPTAIGMRQLAVSTLYTLLFAWGWFAFAPF